MDLKGCIQRLLKQPMRPRLFAMVPESHVLDNGFSSLVFEPNRGYFEIRLSEMFLRDKREYWFEYRPFTVIITDFIFDDHKQTVPFFVGNHLLQSGEHYIQGQNVQYLNTRVAGPIPYYGDTVSLFVGLFRAQVQDLSRTLFDFMERVVGAFDVTKVSSYLCIARALTSGLAALMGTEEMEFRLGTRNEFTDKSRDPHRFRQCYLVYVNCQEDDIMSSNLWVKDARLFVGRDGESIKPFRGYDYCLVKIDHIKRRNDYTKFAFNELWKEARKLIWQGDVVKADRALLSLAQQIAMSADLTTDDRYHLIQLYKANYEREVELYGTFLPQSSQSSAAVTRSARSGFTAKAVIQKAAVLAQNAGFPKEAENALWDISTNWDRIPHLKDRSKDFELTDALLNDQLNELESISTIENRDPKALADAIAVAVFN